MVLFSFFHRAVLLDLFLRFWPVAMWHLGFSSGLQLGSLGLLGTGVYAADVGQESRAHMVHQIRAYQQSGGVLGRGDAQGSENR